MIALLAAAALAQGLDRHGLTPPPHLGDPGAVWVGDVPLASGSFQGSLWGEYVSQPVLRTIVETEPRTEVVLGGLGGFTLAGAYAPHDRVALGLALPIWPVVAGELGGAAAVGDLVLQAPVRLVGDERFRIGIRPIVSIPTGSRDRYLSDEGVGISGMLTVAANPGPLGLYADLGADFDTAGDETLPGGLSLKSAFGAGYVSDRVSVLAELRLEVPPAHSELTVAEAMLSTRGRLGDRLTWTAGVGRGLTATPGAPALRVIAGLGFGNSSTPVVPDLYLVTVRDPDGRPVRGASIRKGDDELGTTDAKGRISLEKAQLRGTEVVAQGLGTVELTASSDLAVDVEMPYLPGQVLLRLVAEDGRPIATPQFVMVGDEGQFADVPVKNSDTLYRWTLPVGSWRVSVSAPERGTQHREFTVAPRQAEPTYLDMVLLPDTGDGTVKIDVQDPSGMPIEGAFVSLGGLQVGTTSSQGTLEVEGLSDGMQTVQIAHHRFEDVRQLEVDTQGADATQVKMAWTEGSVEVITEGPEGGVTDAVVRFKGVDSLPPARLGYDGRRLFVLRPGEWTALVSSPTLGLQQRTFSVQPGVDKVVQLRFRLGEDELGTAELAVRVVDPDGHPIPAAEIGIDDQWLGKLTDGVARLDRLRVGPRVIRVRGAGLADTELPVELVEGYEEVDMVVAWQPGATLLRSLTADGEPVESVIRARGAGESLELRTEGGRAFTMLDPGSWNLLFSSEDHGLQSRRLEITGGDQKLNGVEVVYLGAEGQASLTAVARIEGEPIAGVEIWIDDKRVGTTGSAGSVELQQLSPGLHQVRAELEGFAPATQSVTLLGAEQHVFLDLEAGGGLLEVAVSGGAANALVRVSKGSQRWSGVLDVDGRARFATGPGEVAVLVSSRTSMQTARIEVTDAPSTRLEMALPQETRGRTALLVRVRDEDYQPVPGAEVFVDGSSLGTTSGGGDALFTVPSGAHALKIVPPAPLLELEKSIELNRGSEQQAVRLEFRRHEVQLAVSEAGPAVFRVSGPADEEPVEADGRATFSLRPGEWRAFVRLGDRHGSHTFTVPTTGPVQIGLKDSQVRRVADHLELEQRVPFDLDSAELGNDAGPLLDDVAAFLIGDASLGVCEVQGHTDDSGSVTYNLELSRQRALVVVDALVARGVPPERVIPRWFGMLRPIDNRTTEDAREKNRRVEFRLSGDTDGVSLNTSPP